MSTSNIFAIQYYTADRKCFYNIVNLYKDVQSGLYILEIQLTIVTQCKTQQYD